MCFYAAFILLETSKTKLPKQSCETFSLDRGSLEIETNMSGICSFWLSVEKVNNSWSIPDIKTVHITSKKHNL